MSESPDQGAPPRAPAAGSSTSRLDAILVVGALLIIGGVFVGLFVRDVPQANLPIIASLSAFMAGSILGGYAGFRWGASEAMKKTFSGGGAQ